mgnify:CR=1 FL=1
MRLKTLLVATTLVFALVTPVAYGAGLVPCGGENEAPCQACHISQLIQSVMQWLTGIMGVLLILWIVLSGIYLASGYGGAGAQTMVRKYLATAIVGYIIFASGFFIVDTFMKFLGAESAGPGLWNDIQCTAQPQPRTP